MKFDIKMDSLTFSVTKMYISIQITVKVFVFVCLFVFFLSNSTQKTVNMYRIMIKGCFCICNFQENVLISNEFIHFFQNFVKF